MGASSFELAKLFDQVIGIDYSKSFIDTCNRLLTNKKVNYECHLEGHLKQKLTAKIDADIVRSSFKYNQTFFKIHLFPQIFRMREKLNLKQVTHVT